MSIYLDYSATTPPDERVRQAMQTVMQETWGNPSSLHAYGRRAKAVVEETRLLLSERLECQPAELTFTGGGTEANNLALIGAALAGSERGRHILISSMEHPSVAKAALRLQTLGFEVESFLPAQPENGLLSELHSKIRSDTILCSMMYVHNETGIVFPVEAVAALCRECHITFHCDAVQAFGKIPLSLNTLPVDLLTLSAHKVYGPMGVGALFIRKGVRIQPLTMGGGQEANRRGGTENVPAIAGFGAALKGLAESLNFYDTAKKLQSNFETQLQNKAQSVEIIGREFLRLPYISALSFPGNQNETLLIRLDMNGVAASAGSACSSGSVRTSPALLSMGIPEPVANSTIRFSIGKFTTQTEINEAVQRIVKSLTK